VRRTFITLTVCHFMEYPLLAIVFHLIRYFSHDHRLQIESGPIPKGIGFFVAEQYLLYSRHGAAFAL
jgi:hypothetical protein